MTRLNNSGQNLSADAAVVLPLKITYGKHGKNIMRTWVFIACLGCLGILASCTHRGEVSKAEPSGKRPRLGVYDSRAIAIAFIGSEVYKATDGEALATLIEEYDKAKADGDKKRMEELEALGKARQVLLHKQSFGTAPVDGMLAHINDHIPGIAKVAGVEAILSKWDKYALAKHKNAEFSDVTMALVDAFQPNERQRKRAIDIQAHPPISLEKAGKIAD